MNVTKRYFQKYDELLNLLNEYKELTIDEITEKMNISKTTVKKLIEEFNREEMAIKYNGKYYTEKKRKEECKSYITIINTYNEFIDNPEYMKQNEVKLAKYLNIERELIQKVKTLIRLNID